MFRPCSVATVAGVLGWPVDGGARRAVGDATRLRGMEALFIALMALVIVLSGYVSLLVLYRLFRPSH